jgi:uncharacterized protein DUF3857/transglutaminase superfamily protein
MRNRLSCNQVQQWQPSKRYVSLASVWVVVCALTCVPLAARATDAPPWMHALVNAPLPAHDDKTDAVLLFSEESVSVLSVDKIRKTGRLAYKVLRPGGREYGVVGVPFTSREKVTSLRGWCIPAQGKDYEVKDKEAAEVSLPKIEGSELITDVKEKLLRIPAPDPGNIIGYEYEMEVRPLVLQEIWQFQTEIPARERRYSLQLPPGWEYKSSWINYAEVKPAQTGSSQWQWLVSDLTAIRKEEDMPPADGVAGRMIVSFFPPGGPAANGFTNWQSMGSWYRNLSSRRHDASPEIKQRVAALTASANTQLARMKALGYFVQHDIRYVAIELGIGGWQPHPAAEVFLHRYGDCKDKAALMISMLHEIGVDSFDVRINSTRGAITPETPAHLGFDHAIVAVKLPDRLTDQSLIAVMQHPRHGRLLFFDPTDELTPFGQIGGNLQANYGLLLTPEGGELVELPKQPSIMNSIQRTGKLSLDPMGTLKGEVKEVRLGDRAAFPRKRLLSVTNNSDKIKPIERLLAESLSTFRITRATVVNLEQMDEPFGFNFSFEADNYAKKAGNLLLVRARVIGSKSSAILETKEPRRFPIEFDGPLRDTDRFEITLPPGYEVDEIPPPVNAEYSFASYHSKTEVSGNVIGYTRSFEVKELSVPVSKAEELKRLYRIIAGDERNTVVLRPMAK